MSDYEPLAAEDPPEAAPLPIRYLVLKALSPDSGPIIFPGEVVTLALTDLQKQILINDHAALEVYTEPAPEGVTDGNINSPNSE
jgi:hypothetical protein